MTTMVTELYDALLAAGAPDEKARRAAETMAGYEAQEQRLDRIEGDIAELKRLLSGVDQRLAGINADFERRGSGLEQRVTALAGDVLLLKWMLGFVLAFQVAISLKLFLH